MRLSIWSFNILRSKPNPPPSPLLRGNPLGIWTFKNLFIQITIAFPIVGKNCVQIPYQVPDSIVIYLFIYLFVRGKINVRAFLLTDQALKSIVSRPFHLSQSEIYTFKNLYI